MKKTTNSFFLFFFLFCSCFDTKAYVVNGPVSKSMGGAGRAGVEGSEALLLNPATIKYSPMKSLSGFYSFFGPSLSDARSEIESGLSVVDNNPSNFFSGGASIFLIKKHFPKKPDLKETYIHLSVAEFLLGNISFGFSGFHLISNEENEDKSQHKQWNISLGMQAFFHRKLSFGFVYDNLFPVSSSIPYHIQEKSQLNLGMEYKPISQFKFRFDLGFPLRVKKKNRWIYQLGLEHSMNDFFCLRFGSELDFFIEEKFFTGGLGFMSPKFRFDYAIRWTKFSSFFAQSLKHSLGLRIPF